MNPLSLLALPLACLFVAGDAAALCYAVHDAQDRVVFQSSRSPVPLAGSLSEAVDARFPGARMTISDTLPCHEFDLTTADGRAAASARRALTSAQMLSRYAPTAPQLLIEAPLAREVPPPLPADAPATHRATWHVDRIVETREVPVYVPVYLPPPHAHQRPVASPPVAPSDNACRSYGFFSHCADGTRVLQQGNFRFPADGRLPASPAVKSPPPQRPIGGPR